MEEIKDQAALVGFISHLLPDSWKNESATDSSNMCFLLPSAGLTHANGDVVMPKPEFMPPNTEIPYGKIFEQYGVNDYTVGACCKGAIVKINRWIDEESERSALRYIYLRDIDLIWRPMRRMWADTVNILPHEKY